MTWPAPFVDQGQPRRLSKRKEVNPNLRWDTRENPEHVNSCGAHR